MKVVIVNNNEFQINEMMEQLKKRYRGIDIRGFMDPLMSAKYICNHDVDIVFAEMRMKPADGISLMKVIRGQKPNMSVIITSDRDDYRALAMREHASNFLVRPFNHEIEEEIMINEISI